MFGDALSCGAMKRRAALIILGAALAIGQSPSGLRPAVAQTPPATPCAATPGRHAPAASSSWPSLNGDAGQSNDNPVEKAITARNALKLKVRWCAVIAGQSYPVVAGGRVYVPIVSRGKINVRALDAASGSKVAGYSKDALGGMLATGGDLYFAGTYLSVVDATDGTTVQQISASPSFAAGTFVYPQSDGKVVLAGYFGGVHTSIYTMDPTSNQVRRKLPSSDGVGTALTRHIFTSLSAGSAVYDESSGRTIAQPKFVGSYWFAGDSMAFTVASPGGKSASIEAFNPGGRRVWSRTVGPSSAPGSDWPHAVGASAVYVATLRPRVGVQALDPTTGQVLWTRPLANVQHIVMANNLLFVMTYGLARPASLVILKAGSGSVVGTLVLNGVYPFAAPNELMVAAGMIYVRAASPTGSELVALSP